MDKLAGLKLEKSEKFKNFQTDFEIEVNKKSIELACTQTYQMIEEFGFFKDNNHFLGVLMEEVDEANKKNSDIKSLFEQIKQKVYSNELTQCNIMLTSLKINCLENIIENLQIISCCKKYEES